MISFQRNIAVYLKFICITVTVYAISYKQNVCAFIPTSSSATHSFTAAGPGSITRLVPHRTSVVASSTSSDDNDNDDNNNADDEASRFRTRAESLRDEIRQLEENLGDRRSVNNEQYLPAEKEYDEPVLGPDEKTLRNKRVLVVGANGQLGSMVTRHLLRNHPEVEEVVATVHFVGEFSTRGYGRLSYEVGAEDGVGWIGSAWGEEEQRNARFEFADAMKDYNLDKLRVVEVELLDPAQCMTITEGVDSVIWCATDFNGSTPRSVSSLDFGLFTRAILSPTKGRVEIEGLTNILGGLKQYKINKKRTNRVIGEDDGSSELDGVHDPNSVVLVSVAPDVLMDFETPFGEFNALKRQGENILREGYPSLSHRILQMGKYEDLFVEEALDINMEDVNFKGSRSNEEMVSREEMSRRKINRRDAASAAVEALLDSAVGKTVQVWTSTRG
mmetsp:Transcript_16793/g.19945  ORF Transcript_16793/g.19945 Transcript_16793/m.19945 type:complete len:445 (-) Transcript_16793:250-1584(-)|eukprot:CAMPEP_0198256314 /NCGR_PEP_ID=MMETSP1447-20131203/6260_1 /TAXON_ID=420782 /ORGANISM="Chaetoceros dichaeta, Strain CCMP1751" /LENGTH=444 /DNA_ID=CAMNT_0043942933 /DNA_START=22 /DNA_END=1356 /DNA_ORIENTATION=-